MAQHQHHNQQQRVRFQKHDIEIVTEMLEEVQEVCYISWDFKNDSLILNLPAISNEKSERTITFTHPRSAAAFLDGFMTGWDHCVGSEE